MAGGGSLEARSDLPVLLRSGEDISLSPIPLQRGVFAEGSLAGDLHAHYIDVATVGVQDSGAAFALALPPWFPEVAQRESAGIQLGNFAPQLNPAPDVVRTLLDPVQRSFAALTDLGWIGLGLAAALYVIWES